MASALLKYSGAPITLEVLGDALTLGRSSGFLPLSSQELHAAEVRRNKEQREEMSG